MAVLNRSKVAVAARMLLPTALGPVENSPGTDVGRMPMLFSVKVSDPYSAIAVKSVTTAA